MHDFERSVALNERLLTKLQEYELMLLEASSLPAMLDVLLISARAHFELTDVRLVLYDPQDTVVDLMLDDLDYGDQLQFVQDTFDIQQLYGATPRAEVLPSDDTRIEKAFPNRKHSESVVLLPLVRDGQMVGSLHWDGLDASALSSSVEMDFLVHLSAVIVICYENCVNAERLSQLSLLDPLTRLSNERAFAMELRKEISRAQRHQKPLTLVLLKVDDFADINDNYGHLSGDFALKSISNLISNMLRDTDLVARCGIDLFAALLPACPENKGQEISERMRSEAEFMEIDDRRGANLFASLSVGMTTWNPQTYPAVNMEQLANQMRNGSRQALERSREKGGNRVVVTRLTTMFV
jgi:diguanylate cyclase (GGDEF)-like protein